jgi:hypothetical protein
MKFNPLSLFTFCLLLFAPTALQANEATERCLQKISPYKQAHEKADEQGGIWAQFERRADLRNDSVLALKLDSKIKKLFSTLNYLCKTLNGIPYDDLGRFVAKELEQISIPDFKKKWTQLGKPPERVNSWVEYHIFSKKNLHRSLILEQVESTIQASGLFFDRYQNLLEKFSSQPQIQFIEETRNLLAQTNDFFKAEPYLLQAIQENSRVLYWDRDENYGGS